MNTGIYPASYDRIWTDPEVGRRFVSLPSVLPVTVIVTLILSLISWKLKTSQLPKKWQIFTIVGLSIFSYIVIEYVQQTLWIYQPCYSAAIDFKCFSTTLINLMNFVFPVVLWGYDAFVLAPRIISKIFRLNYKSSLIYLFSMYLSYGVVFLLHINRHDALNIFISAYQNQYSLGSFIFSTQTILVIILTWPALLLLYVFG